MDEAGERTNAAILNKKKGGPVLQVAPETVMRDWKMAKAWLFRELTRAGDRANAANQL